MARKRRLASRATARDDLKAQLEYKAKRREQVRSKMHKLAAARTPARTRTHSAPSACAEPPEAAEHDLYYVCPRHGPLLGVAARAWLYGLAL